MKKLRVVSTCIVWLMLVSLFGCGQTGSDKSQNLSFNGRIDSIDESKLSWEGLRFSLVCLETLEEFGEVIYQAGDEYRTQEIGPDRTFTFELPAEIEEGWIGRTYFTQRSCNFVPIAYNDTNQNGRFDYDPDNQIVDPHEVICESGETTCHIVFIAEPEYFESTLGIEVSYGWNYASEGGQYSTDFDREFVLVSE